MKIFALLDCNNFFVSCERLFRPELRNQPVVVLSNNDGCVIARSNEAKALGIKMGEPVFKCEYLIKRHGVKTFSANFPLYADISHRVMTELCSLVGDIEVYSIDEAFVQFDDINDPTSIVERLWQIHSHIERAVGVPVSIGLATSKTLAKLANHIAKKTQQGVFSFYLSEDDEALTNAFHDSQLCEVDISDIWGIGRGYEKFLRAHSIHTALDLKYANQQWVKQEMKTNGLRIIKELQGISCIPFVGVDAESKSARSIISSRSFGQKIDSVDGLQAAVANFVATAALKLRRQNMATKSICVYVRVLGVSEQSLDKRKDWYGASESAAIDLPVATAYTPELIRAAEKLVNQIYKKDCYYKKAGVILYDLVRRDEIQLSLLDEANSESQNDCADLVDKINDLLGANTLFWAAMGANKQWQAKRTMRSPAYTTDWKDLPIIV